MNTITSPFSLHDDRSYREWRARKLAEPPHPPVIEIKDPVAPSAADMATLTRHCERHNFCLLYTSPSPRDPTASRMPSSA